MAQLININSTEFRRCNISAIQSGGTWASIVPDENEIILISTTNSLTADGSGECDAYIMGDGTTLASALNVQYIATDSVEQGNKNVITSDAVWREVNGAIETNIELIAGTGLTASGTTYNNRGVSTSDFIEVEEGQVVNYSGKQYTNYGIVAGYSTNAASGFLRNLLTGNNTYQTGLSCIIPSDVKYIRVSGYNSNSSSHPADPVATITSADPFVRKSEAASIEVVEQMITSSQKIENTFGVHTRNGYIRTSDLAWVNTNNFRTSVLVPIAVGDVIESNCPYSYPYSGGVASVFFGADAISPSDSAPLALIPFDSTIGSIEITQAMWDAGYRYVTFSAKTEVGLYVKRSRNIMGELNTLSASVEDMQEIVDEVAKSGKIAVLYPNAQYTEFYILIPSKNGNVIRYLIHRHEKVWDSLTYTDGNGQTQTKTNVTSALYFNNYAIYEHKTNTYLAQGNSNFIYKLVGGANHVGIDHGNEVALYAKWLADGKEINPLALAVNNPYYCDELVFIQESETYESDGTGNSWTTTYPKLDTDGNPIVNATHYMEVTFAKDNYITIDNRLNIKRSLTFFSCHGAMLECNFTDFDQVGINNEESTINAISDTGVASLLGTSTILMQGNNVNYRGNKAWMRKDGFLIEQELTPLNVAIEKSTLHRGQYSDRMKIYFEPVKTQDTLIGSETADTFTAGDTIHVIGKRHIVYSVEQS